MLSQNDLGLAVFLVIVLAYFALPSMWKQLMRTLRVALRGWPPAHLDIDGRFHPDAYDIEEGE